MKDSAVHPTVALSFGSPDEFRARPLYRANVAPTQNRPAQVIGGYRFQQPVSCGVKGCTQTHEHGYLVLVKDGVETNTGWDCGLDHFGPGFVEMRLAYDRAEREYPRRLPLHLIVPIADRIRRRIHALNRQPHGGEWLLQTLDRFTKRYPRGLIELLRRHGEQGDEAHLLEAIPRQKAVKHSGAAPRPVNRVRGIKIFTVNTDQWPPMQFEEELDDFLKLHFDHVPLDELARWVDWSHTLELRLAECEHLITEGRKFFQRDNLALLPYIVEDLQLREQLSWIVWSVEVPAEKGTRLPMQPQKKSSWQRMFKKLIDE